MSKNRYDSNSEITTVKKLLTQALAKNNETWKDIVTIAIDKEDLNKPFDSGLGRHNQPPFTAWTARWVYFPTEYDGGDDIGWALRNPSNEVMDVYGVAHPVGWHEDIY